MHLHWHILSSCLLLIWLCPSSALCPSQCTCKQTEKGKRKVACTKGGMTDPIPVAHMDPGMEILEIAAPEGHRNSLTVGAVFQRFKELEELRLRRCGIQQIGMHPFWGVPSIRILDLSSNNISVIVDHNFRGLVNLVELHLDDNAIEKLPTGAFRHLTELRVLTLQRNKLEELLPRLFLKLAKLQVLKLSGNRLEELNPEVFKDVLELRVLECRSCGLRRINTQIYHLLPYLSHLDLGNNRMQFIPVDEFLDLRRLHSLRLDGNQLPVVLERTFANQHQMKTLCLARNRLAMITNQAFLNLSSLVELDIGYNQLDKMEGEVMVPLAESLQKLVISGNHFPMEIVKLMLQVAHKVTDLGMADMGFTDLPEGLLPDRLRHLNVSGNNLSTLTSLPHQLVELDISRNKFRGLDQRVILRLERVKQLHVDHNPWSCDACHVGALLQRANASAAFHNLVCASPNVLANRTLSSLEAYDLRDCAGDFDDDTDSFWDANVGLVVGLACGAVFLAFCVMFFAYACAKRHRAREVAIKRTAERSEAALEGTTAIFAGKGEISFKFALDLTERKVSVSTIDDMKQRDGQLQTLPNGTGI